MVYFTRTKQFLSTVRVRLGYGGSDAHGFGHRILRCEVSRSLAEKWVLLCFCWPNGFCLPRLPKTPRERLGPHAILRSRGKSRMNTGRGDGDGNEWSGRLDVRQVPAARHGPKGRAAPHRGPFWTRAAQRRRRVLVVAITNVARHEARPRHRGRQRRHGALGAVRRRPVRT